MPQKKKPGSQLPSQRPPRVALAVGEWALRTARDCRLVVRFTRPWLPRVDLREGLPVAESSSRAPPFSWARLDRLRSAVLPFPALRSEALTPGFEVSTGAFLGARRGCLGLGGWAARCCSALKICALVAMTPT